jgi:hypothetical protein
MDTGAGARECDILGLRPAGAAGRGGRFCAPFGGPGGGGPGWDVPYAPGDAYDMYDGCPGYGEGSVRTGPDV